ncbi:TetR/AcrR family transcriptional regulator [Sinomonas sp. G460-2]|uniref:TetR/AcrR family transcriptional regulator n=1 Tax=Sinomonas sp. G460-2 TaxID=3393464 RepID=UPI0039F11F05
MTDADTMGRRERKKAATRKAISDAATALFLERGFDKVSIREIAEKADVSPTTVFAHFPQKEALVFDEDDDQREQLVAAVRDRPTGTTITRALRDYFASELANTAPEHDDETVRRFMTFIDETPALADYAQRMWVRHEDALAAAIGGEFGLAEPSAEIRAYARFVIQIQLLVLGSPDPIPVLDAAFRVLDAGWVHYAKQL